MVFDQEQMAVGSGSALRHIPLFAAQGREPADPFGHASGAAHRCLVAGQGFPLALADETIEAALTKDRLRRSQDLHGHLSVGIGKAERRLLRQVPMTLGAPDPAPLVVMHHQAVAGQAAEMLTHAHGRDAQDLGQRRRRRRSARLEEEEDLVRVVLLHRIALSRMVCGRSR
jgi:hypothetical protein